jgi:hypothetical protein
MGGLVPNPNDLQVLNQLNSLFSEPRLDVLRAWISANDPKFFAAGRHLHRLAYRLNIAPTTGPNPRGRWFKFLKDFLKERPYGPGGPRNFEIILSALDGYAGDGCDVNCKGIRFWARYGAAAELPTGIDYKAVIAQDPPDTTGLYWASITLLCRHDLAGSVAPISDPTTANGDADPNENPTEQPPV